MGESKRDFFITRNHRDRAWANWIAYTLEEKGGYTTILQDWDFRAGQNIPLLMHDALRMSDRVILVLSPDFLKAEFTQPEWAAAFMQDPRGVRGRVLPIKVRECAAPGLLAAIIFIDLVGLQETEAEERLLSGVSKERAKPRTSPPFPQRVGAVPKRTRFPGHPSGTETGRSEPHPCSFKVNPHYQDEERWQDLGDVRVEVVDPRLPSHYRVYLIPSDRADEFVRHTRILRRNPEALRLKKEGSEDFVERLADQLLDGYWFWLTTTSGRRVPTVYCDAYDDHLNSFVDRRR